MTDIKKGDEWWDSSVFLPLAKEAEVVVVGTKKKISNHEGKKFN